MSSRLVTSVARPAQYRSARSVQSSGVIATQEARTSPEPTASPARRSSRQNRTSTPVMPGSGTGGDLLQVVPHHVEVVALLHHRAEGVGGQLRVQPGPAEHVEGAGPVDRLG